MLSPAENELLTRVGPGTPMGALLREYWLPILQSFELPEPECPPLRVRLLGENLVAFRDTTGAVGMVADNCPHRGASMFFGRNEEEGLRCVYHGWKFDRSGACVDMPNEPPESNFKHKVRIAAYPCVERNGIIWAYMGPRQTPPPLPGLEWATLPAEHRILTPFVRECNWVQAMEGDIDSSHSSFLHSVLSHDFIGDQGTGFKHLDRAPRFQVVDTEYGVKIGVQRTVDADHSNWRITQYLMPFFTMFPPTGENAEMVPSHVWIPLDDTTTLVWTIYWHPLRPLDTSERGGSRGSGVRVRAFDGPEEYLPATSAPAGAWRFKANRSNDYLLDYEAQKTRRFSGVPTIPLQDQAMTESMGPIMDRTREHLGASDTAIIRARRRLLAAVTALRDEGIVPTAIDNPSAYAVRSASGVIPNDERWLDATDPWLQAEPGKAVVSA